MFGPKKLPEVARNIGKAMDTLRKTSQEFREQVMTLDKEIPKIDVELPKMDIDLDMNQPQADQKMLQQGETGQAELSFEGNESSSLPGENDPYRFNEDQNADTASVAPRPDDSPEKAKEQENAAENNSNPPADPAGISKLENQENGRKDGLAG